MKTILGFNPFNLKPTIKKMTRKPKMVEIPATLPDGLYNAVAPMQNSLNYMATNYGINFKFKNLSNNNGLIVSCEKNGVSYSNKITEAIAASNAARAKYEVSPDIARIIYETASNVL